MIAVYSSNNGVGGSERIHVVEVESDLFHHMLTKLGNEFQNPWPTSDIVFFENDKEVNRCSVDELVQFDCAVRQYYDKKG